MQEQHIMQKRTVAAQGIQKVVSRAGPVRILSIWLIFLASSALSRTIDRNKPHGHHGVLAPYNPGPFSNFQLEKDEETLLAEGKPVMKQIPDTNTMKEGEGPGGRAICIQDVHAPREAVWRQILDVDSYGGKVSSVKECVNYSFQVSKSHVQFKTKMIIGVMPGYSYENYYDHTYHPSHDSVTWSLDYNKSSDFDDVAGHWHLQDHPTKSGYTRVFYACDIKFKNPIPGPIMNILTKAALKNATGWVKRESEENPMEKIPPAFLNRGGEAQASPEDSHGFLLRDKTRELFKFPKKPIFGFRKG